MVDENTVSVFQDFLIFIFCWALGFIFILDYHIIQFWYVYQGESDFLGRCYAKPTYNLKLNQENTLKLEWFQLERLGEDAGQLLACFELYPINTSNSTLPALPPKLGSVYSIPRNIKPQLQRTIIEVNLLRIDFE